MARKMLKIELEFEIWNIVRNVHRITCTYYIRIKRTKNKKNIFKYTASSAKNRLKEKLVDIPWLSLNTAINCIKSMRIFKFIVYSTCKINFCLLLNIMMRSFVYIILCKFKFWFACLQCWLHTNLLCYPKSVLKSFIH